MKYSVNKTKKEAAYLQLYRILREDITKGVYAFGERLPSKRTLADLSGTSVITTGRSYELLEDEGYVEARERSGYYVVYRSDGFFPQSESEDSATGGTRSAAYASRSRKDHTGTQSDKKTSSGKPDPGDEKRLSDDLPPADPYVQSGSEEFPFSVFAKTLRRIPGIYGERILEPSPSFGCPELLTALEHYLTRSRGIHVRREQILIGSGAEYLYGLIAQMLRERGGIALEDPSYERIRKVYEANGTRCELLPMGRDGIRSRALSLARSTVLHVTPYHSYPSGVTASASKRNEYIRWARERSGLIIEDDYDSEFTISSKSEDTLYALEPEESVIYLNSFTRTVSASVRIAYMVLPAKLSEELKRRISFYSCSVPVIDQLLLAELISNGDFERHINRVRRKRRRSLDS